MTLKDLTKSMVDFYLEYGPYEFSWDYAEEGKTPEEVFTARMQNRSTRVEEMENLDLVIENLREQVAADPTDEDFCKLLNKAFSIQLAYPAFFPDDKKPIETKYPVVFINCSKEPFIDRIMHGLKHAETRTRNTLKNLVGQRVYLAETGKGKPVVRCSVLITRCEQVDKEAWYSYRFCTGVNYGGAYDWKPGMQKKYLYWIQAVEPVEPFQAVEGTRHGRTYMTYQ